MSFYQLKQNQSALAGNTLGTLLWWQLAGNHISHDRLHRLAVKHGLDTRHLPAEIKPTQAFRRAWRQLKLTEGLMLRPIAETESEVVIGLVRERPDAANRDLDYDLIVRVSFAKNTARLSADIEHDLVARLREAYRHHLAHTTEDLRALLASFVREAGIRLRDSGGVYFVPESHRPQLKALCAVVEAAGANKTYCLPLADAGKSTLRHVAKKSLDDEIRSLQAELDRFDSDKVRRSTLERKLQGFEDLRSRVKLFARVLSFKAKNLDDKISDIQTGLRKQLGGPQDRASIPVALVTAASAATPAATPEPEHLSPGPELSRPEVSNSEDSADATPLSLAVGF